MDGPIAPAAVVVVGAVPLVVFTIVDGGVLRDSSSSADLSFGWFDSIVSFSELLLVVLLLLFTGLSIAMSAVGRDGPAPLGDGSVEGGTAVGFKGDTPIDAFPL